MTDADQQSRDPATADADRAIGDVSYQVPDGAEVVECAYCGRPFTGEGYLSLHRGLAHPDAISAAEREAYEEVHALETRQLRRFRLKALVALVVLYFGLLMVYAVAA